MSHPSKPENTRQEIGERLRCERERVGISRVDLAQLLKINRMSVTNYEKGLHMPTADQLNYLGSLGMDVAYVVTGTPSLSIVANQERFVVGVQNLQRYGKEAGWEVTDAQVIRMALAMVQGVIVSDMTQHQAFIKAMAELSAGQLPGIADNLPT